MGCQQMDAVTYPKEAVIEYVEHNLVPLQVPHDQQPLASDFNVKWTPTLVLLDREGKEHHRTVGFLSPEELIPSLLLGIGLAHFDRSEFDEAHVCFDKVLADHAESDAAPEALYQRGVTLYKSTGDLKVLKETYELLHAHYPASEWTKRAYPYRLVS